jgi:tetratricopeptide (TPR) repeat protein
MRSVRQGARLLGVAWLVLGVAGCAAEDKVVRVIDGRPVAGDFVPAEAYAAYLRASIADAAGDLPGAIEAYSVAVTLGPSDPGPLAKLGDARCRRDPADPRASAALEKALAIDPEFEPALEASARCAERRHDPRAAVEHALRAMKADPAAAEPLATLARLEPEERGPRSEELRARLVAMTLVDGTNAVAWEALAAWARAHGDALLEARALSRVELRTGGREVREAIARMVGEGNIVAARTLARAVVGESRTSEIDARTARLAIDAAIVEGDLAGARRIALHAGVSDVVVAARALLHGRRAEAGAIARELAGADDRALAPRLIAGAAEGSAQAAPRALAPTDGPLAPEVWLAYGAALLRAGSAKAAQVALAGLSRAPVVAGDALEAALAVPLAAAGALDAGELDANARIELAERRAETVTDDVIAAADARHALLALARRAPSDPATVKLARSLSRLRARDAVVAVAFARLALAGAIDVTPRSMSGLLSTLDPADPLVAGAALDCAVRAGDVHAIPLARARLAGIAHTDAERARVE